MELQTMNGSQKPTRQYYICTMEPLILISYHISVGIEKALVTCDKVNIASAKTAMRNGGVLENEFIEDDGNVVQRYWIAL